MTIFETIEQRKSIRKFDNRSVEPEKIEKIMRAAQLAPSWRNGQCWKFIVVTEPQTKNAVIQATNVFNQSWLGKEYAIIIACGDPFRSGIRGDQRYYLVDVAIAMQNLVLAATALGLGTCWIGAFNEKKMKTVLNVPERFRIVAISPLGYPAKRDSVVGKIARAVVSSKKRKSLNEVYSINQWEEP